MSLTVWLWFYEPSVNDCCIVLQMETKLADCSQSKHCCIARSPTEARFVYHWFVGDPCWYMHKGVNVLTKEENVFYCCCCLLVCGMTGWRRWEKWRRRRRGEQEIFHSPSGVTPAEGKEPTSGKTMETLTTTTDASGHKWQSPSQSQASKGVSLRNTSGPYAQQKHWHFQGKQYQQKQVRSKWGGRHSTTGTTLFLDTTEKQSSNIPELTEGDFKRKLNSYIKKGWVGGSGGEMSP